MKKRNSEGNEKGEDTMLANGETRELEDAIPFLHSPSTIPLF
jgi:hypothetical protein